MSKNKQKCYVEHSEISQINSQRNTSLCASHSVQNDKVSTKDLRVFLGVWAGIFALFLALGYIKNGSLREWAACGVLISLADDNPAYHHAALQSVGVAGRKNRLCHLSSDFGVDIFWDFHAAWLGVSSFWARYFGIKISI